MKQLLAASLLLLSAQAFAQPAAGPFARMVVIQPKPGQGAAFEQGYQRHLEWHKGANDLWTWHGWSFVLGDRLGMFMDGTFGHAAANFDTAVQPAGDAADNAVNVVPYADFLSHGVFRRLESASVGLQVAQIDLSTFDLPITVVTDEEMAAHETVLAELDKASGGKTQWRKLVA